jgi:hypothetical protein
MKLSGPAWRESTANDQQAPRWSGFAAAPDSTAHLAMSPSRVTGREGDEPRGRRRCGGAAWQRAGPGGPPDGSVPGQPTAGATRQRPPTLKRRPTVITSPGFRLSTSMIDAPFE